MHTDMSMLNQLSKLRMEQEKNYPVCSLRLYNQHLSQPRFFFLKKGVAVLLECLPTWAWRDHPLCWCGATLHQCKVAQNLGLRPVWILSWSTCVSLHILLLLPSARYQSLRFTCSGVTTHKKEPPFTRLRPRDNISYSSSGWADPPILKSLL